jgi:hypothetical protein
MAWTPLGPTANKFSIFAPFQGLADMNLILLVKLKILGQFRRDYWNIIIHF